MDGLGKYRYMAINRYTQKEEEYSGRFETKEEAYNWFDKKGYYHVKEFGTHLILKY